MKTKILIALIISVSFGNLLIAQNRPAPRTKRQSNESQKEQVFSTNHSINLQGELPSGKVVNVSAIGVGPLFAMTVPLDDEGGILSCRYNITEQDGKYLVSYSMGVRAKLESGGANGSGNFEYRDYTIEGKALCEVGATVSIFKNGEDILSLSVTEMPEKK